MIRRSPVRKVRSKPRQGRLKGKALRNLREACFERDGYKCRECHRSVLWFSGHMAHIKAKRRHGDSLENVRTLCGECHAKEHNAGGKPCPRKVLGVA